MRIARHVLAAAVFSAAAHATPITLYFSGTSSSGSPTSTAIPNGTTFSGSLFFDPATPNCNCGDSQHRNFGDLNATFAFQIGSGLYDFAVTAGNVGIEVDHNYGANFGGGDVIWFWATAANKSGSGEAVNPISFDNITTILLWRQNGDGIFSTANSINEPPMENLGLWDFAGIDLTVTVPGGSEHYLLSFSEISQVPPGEIPEPATAGVMMAGLIGIGVAVARKRAR